MKTKKVILILTFAIIVAFSFWFIKSNSKQPQPNNSFEVINTTKDSVFTSFEVINTTKDSVLMFLTINYPIDSTYIQSVNGIFGIKSSELQGSIWVQPNDTLKYTPKLGFSGNISFGSPPQNCPTDRWINGVNIFEWSVNVPAGSNESLDLSCVTGVNSFMKIDLLGGADWIANRKSVTTIKNKQMWNNTGIYGVFPYGCTNCINTDGKQPCQTPNEKPNTEKICTPTRAKNEKGGIIRISFLGYTPVTASEKKQYDEIIKRKYQESLEFDND